MTFSTQYPPSITVRAAAVEDAEHIRAIYAPFVRDTPVTFETEVPPLEKYRATIADGTYPWLVAERDGEVIGYTKANQLRAPAAYRWTAEAAVYVKEDHRGTGIGKTMLEALMGSLRERGYATLCAAITQPNPGSVALFESLGFEHAGTWKKVGFKLGIWHDVGWWQRALDGYPDQPAPPT